ncbi:alpha/beta hydrolase [Marinobacter algicola]|uniref:Predicted Hydrolase or acyltransferase (Alpha/beta hydrolase superfamily) protein n=1 Tax=Marinobacter algicola DG893 TaxID=443152 RepID=A6F4D2_9GAMM|nr:alpha/beta hydrolase family protein [Marinobacter algicola]EDM46370.1 predicted Hydrolase or acyltransferase (alpha/beta hydrolase superfamily) protein [Marinobacter algicola DG893]
MTSQLNTQSVIFERPTTHKVEGPKGFSPIRLALQLYGRMSPEKAGRLVNRMAFRPSRLPMPSRYEYLLDNADSYTQLQHGSRTIPVYSWGQGPVILGVHGWAGAGIQFGAWINPLVEAGYRVVLFDAPAHGRAQGESTDLFEMAEVIAKVTASVGRIHGVLAHSMGCIAIARAIADGLQPNYLVMLAPPVSLSAVMDNLGRQLGLSQDVLAVHLQLMEERFGKSVWEQLDLEALSRTLTQRGLMVIDDDDTSISPDESERVFSNWENANVLRTRGLGHHRLLWSPMVLDSVLRDLGRPVDTL